MEVLRTAYAYTGSAMPHVIRFTSPATRHRNTCAPLGLTERPARNYQKGNPGREPGFSSAQFAVDQVGPRGVMLNHRCCVAGLRA
jgi:hypothetical protein